MAKVARKATPIPAVPTGAPETPSRGSETIAKPFKPENAVDLWRWARRGTTILEERIHDWLLPMIKPDAPAQELAQLYVVVRDMEAMFEGALKELKEQKKRLQEEIVPEAYDRDKLTTITLKPEWRNDVNGYRVTISTRTFASIKQGKRDEAFKWLRGNKLGSLIIETVNAQTLSAAVAHRAEDNLNTPEELFNILHKDNTSVTKVD